VTPHITGGLRSRHGFFGRRGGVSKGDLASLNCGYGADDAAENVDENRRRVMVEIGAEALQTCYQVHSAEAVFVTEPVERPRADGLVTTTPGIALGALSADCAPVLLESGDGRVIGACHAGWRGAVSGIADATVAVMRDHGAEDIRAVVGPCIIQPSYEVGNGFKAAALKIDPNATSFFATREPKGDWIGAAVHFDLPNYVLERLAKAGVKARALGTCTYKNEDDYFSYRRNTHSGNADYGRNIAAICIAPPKSGGR